MHCRQDCYAVRLLEETSMVLSVGDRHNPRGDLLCEHCRHDELLHFFNLKTTFWVAELEPECS